MPGDDPFEGLILDEDFIRGARHREPAHADRRPPPPPPPGPRKPRRRRPWGFLIGAVGIITVVAVSITHAHDRPDPLVVAGPAASPSASHHVSASASPAPSLHPSATPEQTIQDQTYVPGACYTWDQRPLHTVAHQVDCGSSHIFQAIGAITITGQPPSAPYPTRAGWAAIGDQQCAAGAAALLKAPVDPYGQFFAGVIHPVAESWAAGDRHAVCGMSRYGDVPGHPDDLIAFRGDVRHLPQRPPAPPTPAAAAASATAAVPVPVLPTIPATGTCEAQKADGLLKTVPCSVAHTVEVVGSFVPDGDPATEPPSRVIDQEAAQHCVALAGTYLGHPLDDASTYSYSYDTPAPEAWTAGAHRISCSIVIPSRRGSLRKP